jgi:pre-mRNA-splicing factor SPF27
MANEVVVDALPYIDQEYDEPGMKEMVQAMIEEEKKRYRPTKNYLEHLPSLELHKFETDVMRKEYERLSQRLPMETLSMKRYELPPPPTGKLTDLSAWNECVENSYAQLEHQNTRICNLELMQEYSCESWKTYLTLLTNMVAGQQKQLADVKRRIQEVNWQRKCNQTDAGEKLKRLESSWVGLVSKNYEIERACIEMEARVQEYQRLAAARQQEEETTPSATRDSTSEPPTQRIQDVTIHDREEESSEDTEKMEEDVDGEEIGPQPYFPDADKIANDPERNEDDDEEDEDDDDDE